MPTGRKPKPTKLKLVDGNPGHTPVNKNEPEPDPSLPPPPEWLEGKALELWEKKTPNLNEIGLVTTADAEQFAFYCAVTAEAQRLAVDVSEHGMTDKRTRRRRPEAVSFENMVKLSKTLAAEFGLTPSSRSRITKDAGLRDKDLDWLFKRNKKSG
jgi:P27 family predicted phage terminase small subunit